MSGLADGLGVHGQVWSSAKAAYPKFKEVMSQVPGKALSELAGYERDNPAGTVNQAMIGGIGATGFSLAKELGNVFKGAEGAPRFEFSDMGSTFKEMPKFFQGKRLGEVLDHPELYKQYPGLADVEVQKMVPTLENYGKAGEFTKVEGRPVIRIRADATPEEAQSTLLHEIQHAIQDREGFPQGAKAEAEGYGVNPGEMEARAVQSRMGLSQAALEASPIKDFIMKMDQLRS